MSNSKVVLGIDPGIKSIGWALIKENSKGEFSEFIDSGSVIFKSVFDPKTFKFLGTKRTEKRQIRRQKDRKKRRLSKLENFLIKSKILSDSIEQLESDGCDIQSILGNPYYLRSKALDNPISGDELAYIILHLFRRRGFKSALKSKTDQEKKSDALTSDVVDKMRSAGCRTIGEYFYKLSNSRKIKIRNSDMKTEEEVNLTGSNLLRYNLIDELEMILEEQSNHNKNITDKVKQEILFQFNFQRPLKAQKKRVFCHLERKNYFDKEINKKVNKGLPCAKKLTAYSQKFIILQTINNIKVTTRDDDPENNHTLPLTVKQKSILFDALWKSKEITFSSLRKKLKLNDSVLINFEFGEKLKLKGNQLYLYFKGNIAKKMKAMSYEELNDFLNDIYMNKGAENIGLVTVLRNKWKWDDNLIELLLEQINTIKPSYMAYSKKAIEKLIPLMENGFMTYDAVENVYGKQNLFANKIVDKLPPFKPTTNKTLNKSISEVRKLVNAIIDRYGKIDIIRLELARELGAGTKKLSEIRSKQIANEKKNNEAITFLRSNNYVINKNNIDKYKLWKESKDQKSLYPVKINGHWAYQQINQSDLFGSNAIYEIDHIYPQSISGDDSFVNKALCPKYINAEKNNRTPYDYYKSKGMDQNDLNNLIKNAYQCGKDKGKRFAKKTEELVDDITSTSSLVNIGYIAKELKNYLSFICSPENIEVSKGGYTAMLRHELDLNKLLGDSNKKSRLDHRHHMVDALVIAMTSKNTIECLNQIRRLSNKEIENRLPSYLNKRALLNKNYKIRQEFNDKFDKTLTFHELENKKSGAIDDDTILSMMKKITVKKDDNLYFKLEKVNFSNLKNIEDIDNKEFENCVFVKSGSYQSLIANKDVSEIKYKINNNSGETLCLPKEIIDFVFNKNNESKKMPTYFQLENGSIVKKVKLFFTKSKSQNCHFVKNKKNEVIGFKKTGGNFCVDKNHIVQPLFYSNNIKDEDILLYKGSILKKNNEYFKVYQFSGGNNHNISISPINFVTIENRDVQKKGGKSNNKVLSMNQLKSYTIVKNNDYFSIV